jgi:hypothetical protein
VLVVVSHAGASAEVHCAELVQPARHIPAFPQTGVAPLQSASEAHSTQALFRQWGVLPEHSASDWHWTHVCVVDWQTGRVVGQFVALMQPTHAPVAGSHIWPLPHPMAPPSAEHDGRQVCVAG